MSHFFTERVKYFRVNMNRNCGEEADTLLVSFVRMKYNIDIMSQWIIHSDLSFFFFFLGVSSVVVSGASPLVIASFCLSFFFFFLGFSASPLSSTFFWPCTSSCCSWSSESFSFFFFFFFLGSSVLVSSTLTSLHNLRRK